MSFTVCGIPMAMIPHPQGAWLEGINSVTNLQWQRGVEPLMNEGAKYCLLESRSRGDFTARQFGDYRDLLDTIGHDNAPKSWKGEGVMCRPGVPPFLKWRPITSPKGFNGKEQPAVNVSWYEAKAWTLTQGGLYSLTDAQWVWSAQGGKRGLKYATETGKLFGTDGKKLVHCSVETKEPTTVDVNDPKYTDGPFELRHKTGNVLEWVEWNPDEKGEFGLRGGSWDDDLPEYLQVAYRYDDAPISRGYFIGFRVGAPAPQDSR